MKFALFCTYDTADGSGEGLFLIAVVDNEIEAVQAFNDHVGTHGKDHVSHIHMEPMRDGWSDEWGYVFDVEIDRDGNLFRQPVQA